MNPFLPLWEYTPDGEPHIFGDRIYLFGSHDTEGGDRYCSKGDYVGWSAPLDDLSDWRYEGVMYSAEQHPHPRPGVTDLYAPDVVQSKDAERFITNLKDNCMTGFKYFDFDGPVRLVITTRGAAGTMQICLNDEAAGEITLPPSDGWQDTAMTLDHTGTAALYLIYHGEGPADLLPIRFEAL